MAHRFATVIGALVSAYAFLLFHLYQLQLVKGDYYLAKADSQVSASVSATARRGAIYFLDKNGGTLPAAMNQNFPVVYAVPKAIEHPQQTAAELAAILNMPASKLGKLLANPQGSYALLARKADPAAAEKISGIKGVYSDYVPERFYPLAEVASHVTGYVGPNATNTGESGRYGIERFYDASLGGGSDLTLTIDPNIQSEAEKILNDFVAKYGATGGSVIVEDPQTGKILAMGATPSFNPNDYAASPVGNFLNPLVQAVYEPGSIFKVLTMAAGIDAGKITPDTTYTDYGFLKIGNRTIKNYDIKKHGAWGPGTTMRTVIEHSINTGAVFAENQTGNATFAAYLRKFGFAEKTGVDLPGEVGGNLSQLSPKARQIVYDTASYGQGVSVTPIGLVNAIAAIANGGTLMRPYINAAITPRAIRRVIATSTAEQVADMMVSAVDANNVARIDGFSIAGKTGSAYIPDLAHGGYKKQLIDSYAGFGPVSHPRFVALIRLDTLPESSLAAEVVVPAFRELAQYIINYYAIQPDRLSDGKTSKEL